MMPIFSSNLGRLLVDFPISFFYSCHLFSIFFCLDVIYIFQSLFQMNNTYFSILMIWLSKFTWHHSHLLMFSRCCSMHHQHQSHMLCQEGSPHPPPYTLFNCHGYAHRTFQHPLLSPPVHWGTVQPLPHPSRDGPGESEVLWFLCSTVAPCSRLAGAGQCLQVTSYLHSRTTEHAKIVAGTCACTTCIRIEGSGGWQLVFMNLSIAEEIALCCTSAEAKVQPLQERGRGAFIFFSCHFLSPFPEQRKHEAPPPLSNSNKHLFFCPFNLTNIFDICSNNKIIYVGT